MSVEHATLVAPGRGITSSSHSVWFDIPVVHLSDAMAFYQHLLGWNYRQMENSPEPDYVMIDAGGQLIGGLRKVTSPPASGDVSVPILYFTVEVVSSKAARAKELGATLVGAIVDLGKGRGRYQWMRDREGNLIGLWGES